jgi:hypothetical protein
METTPLILAEVTGTVAQFCACVAGLKVSVAAAGSLTGKRVVEMV